MRVEWLAGHRLQHSTLASIIPQSMRGKVILGADCIRGHRALFGGVDTLLEFVGSKMPTTEGDTVSVFAAQMKL